MGGGTFWGLGSILTKAKVRNIVTCPFLSASAIASVSILMLYLFLCTSAHVVQKLNHVASVNIDFPDFLRNMRS